VAPIASAPAAKREPAERVDAGAESIEGTAPKPAATAATTLDEWLGLYRGNDTTVFLTAEQPERRFDDPKAKIRVERGGKDHLDFTLIDSSNDKDMCHLSATFAGDTATIEPGQACFLDPEESMTVKSRPGKATYANRRLLVDLVLDTVLETELGPSSGTIEYHFDGRR
jgi:hypothetical protein